MEPLLSLIHICSVTTNSTGTGVQETPPAPPAPSRVSVTGIEVEPETLLLKVQKTAGLTAKIQPANATEQGVAWSSSDEDVAVVDDQGPVSYTHLDVYKRQVYPCAYLDAPFFPVRRFFRI